MPCARLPAGPPLAASGRVDRGVLATANELFEARHYPGVVALVDEALEAEPEHVPLLLLRARAQFALRRDLEAQSDLRDIIRLDPQCATAYRMLGELAARRDEYESAAIFFREAVRLAPDDEAASDWLTIVEVTSRPAAAASKLPAPAAAAGRFPRGTRPPSERPTKAYSEDRKPFDVRSRPIYIASFLDEEPSFGQGSEPGPAKLAAGTRPEADPMKAEKATIHGPPALGVRRGPIAELPGFGDYLVAEGILTRERLRAAQAYQRSMKVQLSTAIVTLGLATPQRIEWAAVQHSAQRR